MKGNILDFTLNAPFDIFTLLKAVVVWYILWHLIIKRILKRSKVTSFWYKIYELGILGALGIVMFLSIIVILFIASIQAIIEYGIKILFPMFLFWGGFISFTIFLIRYINKEK